MRRILSETVLDCRTEGLKAHTEVDARVRVTVAGRAGSADARWAEEPVVELCLDGDEAGHDQASFHVSLSSLRAALETPPPSDSVVHLDEYGVVRDGQGRFICDLVDHGDGTFTMDVTALARRGAVMADQDDEDKEEDRGEESR